MTTKNRKDSSKLNWQKAVIVLRENTTTRHDEYNKNPKHCKFCKTPLCYKKRRNTFCSNSCAAAHNNKGRERTIASREKTKKSVLCYLKENPPKTNPIPKSKICSLCKQDFPITKKTKRRNYCVGCLKIRRSFAGRVGGRIAASNRPRRSKNEMLFAKLCAEYFENVRTNEPIFNGWDADVIIDDIKIAVLWNGVWHYKKVTESHSLIQVQTRDKIKIKEIAKSGFSSYIIKDMGSYNPDFVNKQFNKFIGDVT